MPAKSQFREVPSPNEDPRFSMVLKRCYYPCGEPDLPINGTFSLLFLERMFFCRWTLQMPGSLQTDYLTRRYQNLSKKIRILSPKNGGTDNERVVRSKKRHFLTFFVNRCLTDGYADFYL